MESLKKYLVAHFAQMPCVEGMENNELILITAAGIISGTFAIATDDVSDPANLLAATTNELAHVYREDCGIPVDATLDGNDGCIALKDVTIRNGQNTFNTPFLCVFFDQIIGASLGKLN